MEIFDQYQEELNKDMYIDELNVTQAAYNLPSIKHKWVSRLINTKIKINKLEKLKKDMRDKIIDKLKSEAPNLSDLSIDKSVTTNSSYKQNVCKIDEELEQLRIIVLYLEKIENIFKNMTFDLKNIIDLTRLETT